MGVVGGQEPALSHRGLGGVGRVGKADDTTGCVLWGGQPRSLSGVIVLVSPSWEGGQRAAGR